jgi:hypothetical protein
MSEFDQSSGTGSAAGSSTGRRIGYSLLGLFALLLLYYPVGMLITHKIDDNIRFESTTTDMPGNGSRAVAMATALIEREVDLNGWVA